MCLEIPGQQPKEIVVPVEGGIRSKEFTRTIELEEYELTVGDSVLFYAGATDIDTGSEPANRTSSSDVYFIEIRPYRQNWVPMPGGKESPGAGAPLVELLNILEYTRAILKKTWAIASKPELTEQDRSRLGFINQDVQYCGEQVALIRDDSQYGFEEPHKIVLNEVIRYFKQTSRYLASYDATSAMVPEKSAYRILRKFILELELTWSPPPSGQSPQPKKPDSVKLQEKSEFTGYEKERIEAQLKKMQQKLDKLTREQGELQWSFENFLEQQAEKKNAVQQNSDSKPSSSDAEKQDQDANNAGQQSASADQKDKSPSSGQSAGSSQDSAQKEDSSAKSQSAGKGTGASGHLIVKVPATARMVPANRVHLPKVKVPGKAQELRALPMVSRMIPEVRKMLKARVPVRVRAHRKLKVPAMEQVPMKAELMHNVRAAGKTAVRIPKPDSECSRQSRGLSRSRSRN
jgi:hypothetical protein